MSRNVEGLDSLYQEFAWLEKGMDVELSDAIHEVVREAHYEMSENLMPWDTGFLSQTTEYDLGYMSGRVFNFSTHYAGFVDGSVEITARPYTITPFVAPTIEFINDRLKDRLMDVVSARRG